ncbi:HYR domain-containing protein [Cystobacter ferrugineus]|uniref:Hemolysin n=1 Tax=Cystobacter ferrugineus TaxID=83449 RepID=A0A1L9BDK3_9BACT|nr:HYR domain-containing protein [Cystobacter ferrugineus]OJH40342.1 hemolysin [Cystobacter ferrugineus]
MAWVALASGAACTSNGDKDAREGTSTRSGLVESCTVRPPSTGNFEPELKWSWTGGTTLPEYKQVMMTPVVVDVNGDHIADIIFGSFAGTNYATDGVLRAISGDDGHEVWTVTDPALRVKASASLAAGDIDGDGKVEICAIPENGRGVLCFEHDGGFKFRTPQGANDYNEWGGPSFADLEGDGKVEIIDGNRVYTATGQLKWSGVDGMGGAQGTGPVSFAVDLDGDGKQEVINDRAVYRHDGTLKCSNTLVPHGFAGVANFDADPAGEIVVTGHGKVSLLDDNCGLLWSRDVHVTGHAPSEAGHGGAPNIADFDGDGKVEIGLAGDWNYTVYKADGGVLWTKSTRDFSSGRTTSTTFDFEDDGKLEVIYGDELHLRILDGATGAVRFEVPNSSGTTYEYPIVADLDGNQVAELLVVTNNHAASGTNGLRVYHDKKEGWAHARPLWNQHAYSVTNVNDDGSIPARPVAHWLQPRLNLFRSNLANATGEGPSPYAASDLLASDVSALCVGSGWLALTAMVHNQGERPVGSGVKVAFYRGNPASGGQLLGVATVAAMLPVGGSEVATVSVTSSFTGISEVWAVVDDDGAGHGRETECREGNNSASGLGDLTCSVTPANKPPVALCRDVTVDANAACLGTASVNHGSHDPDNGPSPLTLTEEPAMSFGPGTHPVKLTVSDGDASASCVGTVTVVDTSKPSLTCPAARVLDTCSPSGTSVSYSPTAADNCGAATVTCSHASGSTFPVGSTDVSCTAKDPAGNTNSCQFNVRVRGDATPPVLSCPTAPVVANTCSASGSQVHFNTSASDTCGAATVTCSHASGSSFPVGNTDVSCTAKDPAGNTASCAFSVQVKNGADPSVPPVAGESKELKFWAPTTFYETVSLSDCAAPAKDSCGNPLPLETHGRLLRVTSDEEELDEDGDEVRTCHDIVDVWPSSVKLRAERRHNGNGRVYTLHYAVKTSAGATTESTCRVLVPYHPLFPAVDNGPKFCVGTGCPSGTTEGNPRCWR